MNTFNLITVLNYIKENKITDLINNLQIPSELMGNMELLELITSSSSNNKTVLELTELGHFILKMSADYKNNQNYSNEPTIERKQILDKLNNHDQLLDMVLDDLHKIKRSLGALSLDMIKDKGSMTQNQQLDIDSIYSEKNLGSKSLSKTFPDMNNENVSDNDSTKEEWDDTDWIDSLTIIRQNLDQQTIETQNKIFRKLHDNKKNLLDKMTEKNYIEAIMEAYLLLDLIFSLILSFKADFKLNTQKKLIEKYFLIDDFPLKIKLDFLHFIEQAFLDIQKPIAEQEIKLGEKVTSMVIAQVLLTFDAIIAIMKNVISSN